MLRLLDVCAISAAMRIRVLLTTCLLSSSVFSQGISLKIDSYIKERESRSQFSGVILVAQDGRVLFEKAYGMANYEFSIPNTLHTKFRIASLTKPFTALAIMMLYENGKLDLQDPISKYIKECPQTWHGVTIQHLLTHTSGIPDLFGDMKPVPVEDTVAEIDRAIANTPNKTLRHEPGEVYEYSNFGYCLLGYIVEKVSRELYATSLNDLIFRRLGMRETLYDDPRPIVPNRARGYNRREKRFINDKPSDPAAYSAGGLLSTVGDLLILDQALYTNKLLSNSGLNQMFTAFKDEYGYGWKVTTQYGRKVLNHTGGTNGFSSHIARYPDGKWLIVVLSNIEEENPKGIACDLAGIIFGAGALRANKPLTSDENSLSRYVGVYEASDGSARVIRSVDGHLVYEAGASSYKLVPLSPNVFFLETAEEVQFQFVPGRDGRATEMIRSSCGKEELRLKKH